MSIQTFVLKGTNISGRPCARKSNRVYADGIGGLIDMRLDARGMSLEEIQAENGSLRDGSNRGLQKVVKASVIETIQSTVSYALPSSNLFKLADWFAPLSIPSEKTADISGVISFNGSTHKCEYVYRSGIDNGWVILSRTATEAGIGLGDTVDFLILQQQTNISVSGDFLTTDVIADPADILANPDLKDGWLGGWGGVPADAPADLVRKAVNSVTLTGSAYTVDGSTWLSATNPVIGTLNQSESLTVGNSYILNYTAHAYMTEECDNTTVKYGDAGISNTIYAYNMGATSKSACFMEGLINKVATSSSHPSARLYGVDSYILSFIDGTIAGDSSYRPKHEGIVIIGDTESPAIKILPYAIEDNGQAKLACSFNELVYTASWNDDGSIHIADGTTTDTDLGGNTRLIGSAKTAMPLGWIKGE